MKYLIDFRYKTINAILLQIHSVLGIVARGRSEELTPTLEALQEKIPTLESMNRAPYGPKEILLVDKIITLLKEFLFLPDTIEEIGYELLDHCKILLGRIDPFVFKYDDNAKPSTSTLIDLLNELNRYISMLIPSLQGLASSLIDEMRAAEETMNDISRLKIDDLPKEAGKNLEKLFIVWGPFSAKPTVDEALTILELIQEITSPLHSEKLYPIQTTQEEEIEDPASELLECIYAQYLEAEKKMTTEAEDFAKYTEILRHPFMIEAVSILPLYTLPPSLESLRTNILYAYEHANQEDGATLTSRLRALDLYRLFGNELFELKETHLQDDDA